MIPLETDLTALKTLELDESIAVNHGFHLRTMHCSYTSILIRNSMAFTLSLFTLMWSLSFSESSIRSNTVSKSLQKVWR